MAWKGRCCYRQRGGEIKNACIKCLIGLFTEMGHLCRTSIQGHKCQQTVPDQNYFNQHRALRWSLVTTTPILLQLNPASRHLHWWGTQSAPLKWPKYSPNAAFRGRSKTAPYSPFLTAQKGNGIPMQITGSGIEAQSIFPPALQDPSQQEALYCNADFLGFQTRPLSISHPLYEGVRQHSQFYEVLFQINPTSITYIISHKY